MNTYSISIGRGGYRILHYEPILSDNTATYDIPLGCKLLADRDIRLFWNINWEWDAKTKALTITKDQQDLDFSIAKRLVDEVQDQVTAMMTWAMVHKRLLSILTAGSLP